MELEDTTDSKSVAERRNGSTPLSDTYLPIAEMEQQESSKLRWCKTPYVGSSPTGQTCYQ